jgi:hypothetical protein
VVELADTRHSECRALEAWEFDSPLGHSNNESSIRAALIHTALIRAASIDAMTQGGQCPVEPHKLHRPGATPGPATDRTRHADGAKTAEYANRQSGGVESAVTLWVRLPPRSIRLTAKVQSPKPKVSKQKTTAAAVSSSFRLWTLDVGLWTLQPGLLVKREDACLASRKSGFDSPAVH